MTIKEAILKSLEDINDVTNYMAVHDNIINKRYYDFKEAKTPPSTISALLGDFIRTGDTRVKRIKQTGGTYSYYLTKNENNLDLISLTNPVSQVEVKKTKTVGYNERHLHKLLSSYLKNTEIYSKTIFHEQSFNSKDSNQKWVHPDMVGIRFLNLQTKVSQTFLKAINRVDTFKISSFEIKKEINSDYELKSSFSRLYQIQAGPIMDT